VEVEETAEAAWVERSIALSKLGERFSEECTPGYYNREGEQRSMILRHNAPFGAGSIPYFRILEDWRREGGFQGLRFA
jgi:cyclohexanone monooxygenase